MAGPSEGGVPRVPPVAGGVRVGMRLGPRALRTGLHLLT